MEKRTEYVAPEVEILEVEVEAGFAASGDEGAIPPPEEL